MRVSCIGNSTNGLRLMKKGSKTEPKAQKKDERNISIHSEVLKRLKEWMPEAATNNSKDLIWAEDYRATIEDWNSRFAEHF